MYVPMAAAEPMSGIQLVTLVLAGIAAVSGIAGAWIAASSATKRERSSWLRDEQVKSYVAFMEAAWAYVHEITDGAVNRALHDPKFEGLDESFELLVPHDQALSRAQHRMLVLGGRRGPAAGALLQQDIVLFSTLAYPVRGALPQPAHDQRLAAIDLLLNSLVLCSSACRADLGLIRRRHMRQLDAEIQDWQTRAHRPVPPSSEDARATLTAWRVRSVGDAIPRPDAGYSGHGGVLYQDPWGPLSPELRPIAAILHKEKDGPWRAQIADTLSPELIAVIESEMAGLVITAGRGGVTQAHGAQWFPYEDGDQFWRWLLPPSEPHTVPVL